MFGGMGSVFLADFGAVNLLNYRALTDAIYRVWYGAADQAAALQLATVLVALALMGAGRYLGLGGIWERLAIVQRFPILK